MDRTIEQLKVPVLVVLITILLLKIFGPIPFRIDSTVSNSSDLFTSVGSGEATGTPKTASFSVGVTKTGSAVETTQEQTNTAVNKVIDALTQLGINKEDIKTDQYSVNPNIDFAGGTQVTTGYTVSTTLSVTIKDAKKASAALDAATKAGANTLNGVSFVLSDDDKEKLEDEAREKAIQDAKRKAEKISKQAGIRLGKVINIYETGPNDQVMFDSTPRAAGMNAKESSATQLQTGENKITVEVTLSYETL